MDGFIISLSQKHIFPVEMMEKYPIIEEDGLKLYGIDAGRIMMLLRFCLPNNSDALFIIREVEKDKRKFVWWKYITLSKMIMSSSWNLRAGGKGMWGWKYSDNFISIC